MILGKKIFLSDIDNVGGYPYVGLKVYGKSLQLPLNFVVNLKSP